jgi:lysophospholipase L1-like esterase
MAAGATLAWAAEKPAAAEPARRPDPARFAKDIAKFDKQFEEAPVTGGVVFTGSSSIRLWKLEPDFPGLPVLNRGFGGSVANDLIVYADQVVLRYKPKVLVVYTGSNDIHFKLTPEAALADYVGFLDLVHKELPDTRVVVNAVKVSESRIKQMPDVKKLNALLEAWCAENPWTRWVDSGNYLIKPDGSPDPVYFRKDRLHLNEAGYKKWQEILLPVVQEEWARVTK